MGDAVLVAIVVVVFAAVLGGLWALAARVRRTGVGTGMLGPFDEIWHPVAVDSRIEIEAAEYRPADAPAPGDPPDGALPHGEPRPSPDTTARDGEPGAVVAPHPGPPRA